MTIDSERQTPAAIYVRYRNAGIEPVRARALTLAWLRDHPETG